MLACALLLLGGCRARAAVTIRIDDSGAGEVAARITLDRAAVAAVTGLGESLEDAVRLDGFADAGWKIDPWVVHAESGRAVLGLRKSFSGATQLESVLRELGGDLVEVDVALERSRGVLASSDGLRLSLDATELAVRVTEDPVLSSRLAAAGLDVAASDAELTTQLAKSLRVDVRASLGGADRAVELRAGESAVLDVDEETTHWGRLVAIAVALALGVLGLGLVMLGTRQRRH